MGWGGEGLVEERIAGGDQVFWLEHVKFKVLIRHLITCSVFESTGSQTHLYHLEIYVVSGKKITKVKWLKQIRADFLHIKAGVEGLCSIVSSKPRLLVALYCAILSI